MPTKYGTEISRKMKKSRIDELINQFYKILPMKESQADTLSQYVSSLLREMLGMQELMLEWKEDGRYLSLCGILQSFVNNPDMDVLTVRSDVFKAISIIKNLQKKYSAE